MPSDGLAEPAIAGETFTTDASALRKAACWQLVPVRVEFVVVDGVKSNR